MPVLYFKRYRMEFDLAGHIPAPPDLPEGYSLFHWDPLLLSAHAEAKYGSFCFEIDAHVFPCLGEREGCQRLMQEIAGKEGFLPDATWLIGYRPIGQRFMDFCGTIQGIAARPELGAVQNLGVTPAHRGRGLSKVLMCYALAGFRAAGLKRVTLEVTAQNVPAVQLYDRLGFRRIRTSYKACDVAYV
jgi:ribosomal protein S18 acetylase RimI-like enzyme